MELMMRLAHAKNSRSIGNAATSVAAISPDQSGPVCGVWDLNTPSATVSTRDESVYDTIRGQKYSFHAPM